MADKIVINLKTAQLAQQDCLPHAAMTLGSARGSGVKPAMGMVSRLVIEEQLGGWVLYRMDDSGGFVSDSWHDTRDDAMAQARREFALD